MMNQLIIPMIMTDNKNLPTIFSVYRIPQKSLDSVVHSLLPRLNQDYSDMRTDITFYS